MSSKRLEKHNKIEVDKNNARAAGHWGVYTSWIYEQAELAWFERDMLPVIELQSQVGYLQAAGPTNHKKFDPQISFIAPGCADRLVSAAAVRGVKPDELRAKFIEVAQRVQIDMKIDLDPESAWILMNTEIDRLYPLWSETGRLSDEDDEDDDEE